MLRRSALLAVLVLVGLVAACDPSAYLPPVPGEGEGEGEGDSCSGDELGLAVTTDSLTPVITFTDGALGLAVSLPAPDSGTRLWVLSSASGTPFTGPVTYGTVPSGTLEAEGAATALTAATAYWVTLTGGDGSSSQCVEWTTPAS